MKEGGLNVQYMSHLLRILTLTFASRVFAVAFLGLLIVPSMASADVPVRVVRFNGPGIETFQSIGFDQQERVYAMFCKEDKGDCWLYRWDPKTGQKDALGSLTEAAERVGNMGPNQYWPNKEYIVKGPTHIWYLDGMMWMGTMGGHFPLFASENRGGHIFAYDIATNVLTDYSQWQPKGIFGDRNVFQALTIVPEKNLLIALGQPGCDIIIYNTHTRETKHIQGNPRGTNDGRGGRDSAVLAGGDYLYQCDYAGSNFAIYNINTGVNTVTNFKAEDKGTKHVLPTGDGQKAYINDLSNIYEFNRVTRSGRLLTPLVPSGTMRTQEAMTLSLDEKKIYYVVNVVGSPADDLYEYNIETGVRTKLMNLKAALGGEEKLSGGHTTASNGKIYFAFQNGKDSGIIEIDVSSRTGPKPGNTNNNNNPVCGNNICESGETTTSCPQDCHSSGPVCGNNVCESGENTTNCSRDCHAATPTCTDAYPSGSTPP